MRATGLAFIASCAAALVGCTSDQGGCGSRKCGAPQPPATSVHLSLGGHDFVLAPGQSHLVSVRRGRRLAISVTVSSPTGAVIKDLYLIVNGSPSGLRAGVPTGRVEILNHHAGPLATNQRISATWVPETLFGTNRLDLSLDYSVGDTGIGTAIAKLNLTS